MNFFKRTFLFVPALVLIAFSMTAQTRSNRIFNGPGVKLVTSADSLQYTLGAFLGQWILNNGFMVNNRDIFHKGLDDVLLNKALMIDAAKVAVSLDSYQKRLISERSGSQEKLLFENIRGKDGVGMLPSGVAYVIMKPGSGYKPTLNDSVLVHVKGFLPDGKQFEDTYAKGSALRTTPANLIPGIAEAIQIMPVGSTWRVFIPSALGYAEKGVAGSVPAYSALIFEVELLNAVPTRR